MQQINFVTMALPSEFSTNSEQILRELFFELTESNDNGMSKFYEWTNENMKLGLVYDRGYYDCYVLPHKKPIESLSLPKLLRFVKSDANFYKKELVVANLWYTLPVNEYVELFYKNYDLVKEFLSSFNQETYDNYSKYVVEYNGNIILQNTGRTNNISAVVGSHPNIVWANIAFIAP